MEREDLTFNFSHNFCMTFEVNYGPLSDITCCRRLVFHQTCFRYSFKVCSAMISFLQGEVITALLNQSTTMNMKS